MRNPDVEDVEELSDKVIWWWNDATLFGLCFSKAKYVHIDTWIIVLETMPFFGNNFGQRGQLSFILKANCPTDKTMAEQAATRSKMGMDLGGLGTEVKWAWS